MAEQVSRSERAWALVQTDPEVEAAHAAIEAHEAEEDRLSRELWRAIRRAQERAEAHLDRERTETDE